MAEDATDVKRRFDDVYRILLVIGPVLSFSYGNYSGTTTFTDFVYSIGFPALMTAVLFWAVPHMLKEKWEYEVKLIGYGLIWFTFLMLAAIVYMKGDLQHSAWFFVAVIVTMIVVLLTGFMMLRTRIISKYYIVITEALVVGMGLLTYSMVN